MHQWRGETPPRLVAVSEMTNGTGGPFNETAYDLQYIVHCSNISYVS